MNRKIMTILCFVLITILTLNTLTIANIDLSHRFNEDNKLLEENVFFGNCTNNEISCVKILARYEGFHDLVDELKDWKKNVEDDTEDYFLWPLIRKGLVGVGGSVLTYFYPLKSLKAMTSLSAYCHANKDLIEPTGDTTRSVLGSLASMKNKIFEFFGKKKERILNPNKGVVGDLTEFLCGTGKEDGKYVTIKKEEKEKFIEDIFKELKSAIKKKEYQGKEIMILTLDLKNLDFGLKFDVVGFNPHYDKPLDKYFKSRYIVVDEF